MNISSNINFKGKFILYGQKETVDKTKEKIKTKSEKNKFLDIPLKNKKITIVTTGKDCITLENASKDENFCKNICETIKRDKKNSFSNLVKYLFGTDKDIPLLQETALNEALNNKNAFEDIDYNYGGNALLKNKRHIVRYVDGSTRLFSKKGIELEQTLKDGTKIRETASGNSTIYTYTTGVIERYNQFGKLASRKFPNGEEEIYYANNRISRISKKVEADGTIIHYTYKKDSIFVHNNKGQTGNVIDGKIIWHKPIKEHEKLQTSKEDENSGISIKKTRTGGIQKCKDGKILEEIFPDGRIKRYEKGVIIEIFPDGRRRMLNRFGIIISES